MGKAAVAENQEQELPVADAAQESTAEEPASFSAEEEEGLLLGFDDAMALEKHPPIPEKQEQPAAAEEPAEESRATVAQPPEPAEKADPMASRIRTMEGRIGALTDQVSSLVKALNESRTQQTPAGAATPTDKQVAAAATSGEKWAKLVKEFPEWAEATEEFVSGRLSSRPAQDDSLSKLRDEIAEEMVNAALPDWEWTKSVSRPEFADWLNGQGDDLKSAAMKSGAAPTLKVLRAYMRSPAAKDDPYLHLEVASADQDENNTRSTALEAAAMPSKVSRPRREPSRTEEDDLEEGFKRG